ncbi:hypothetical protein [Sphingobium nicotianae]|uniref:DUF4440 domain-containing protein n=1 Tax=Sphingobium nicotianae TaxID=2782607 RepID=A0A9X1DA52_9SPHN|nr:hypothetical protein [Sphingobium nicotianae]MBT2186214.1 hypothetical protein [Sphingobium nicotianae]
MIRKAACIAAIALVLGASLAGAQGRRGGMGGPGRGNANPSAIVSAELAFARLAQDKGQWTAFRETADKDAVMFMPDAVNAQSWLKKRADPARALSWQPYRVFVSCDGTYALSTGPWSGPNGGGGTFNTIWRRQKDGDYKWVVDFGSPRETPKQDEVIIEGKVAECRGGRRPDGFDVEGLDDRRRPPRNPPVTLIANPPPLSGDGQSNDGSLHWRWTKGEKENSFEVTMRESGGDQKVVIHEVVPNGAP